MIPAVNYDFGRGITAFSTLRGDCSESDPYSGFNACHYVGDSPAHVAACRRLLAADLRIPESRIVIPRQTHSSDVAVIRSTPVDPGLTDSVDALVTGLKDVVLCVNTADCVPVLLSDREAGVIAAVHSGWRGTAGLISLRTVEAMVAEGASAKRIKAAMGPSICPGCFEVGPETAAVFNNVFGTGNNIVDNSHGRLRIDLAAAIRQTLLDAGLSDDSISDPPACSRCFPGVYFSARAMGIASGRTLSLILQTDLLDRPVE